MAAGNADWARTCWRGVELWHPRTWELTSAAAGAEPCRLAFGDRRRERMTVQWRKLAYAPDLTRALDRRRKDGDKVADLTGLPNGWRGTTVPVEDGVITHAGCFFAEFGLLVEFLIVWPGQRDAAQECKLLESVRPVTTGADETWWEAMGLRAVITKEYALEGFGARVGLVEWRFRERGGGELLLQRLALPNYWLRETLGAWLRGKIMIEADVTGVKDTIWNGHAAVEVTSRSRTSRLKRMLGLRKQCVDVAWCCPQENRVYRLHCGVRPRAERAVLPTGLRVACCRPVNPVADVCTLPAAVVSAAKSITGVDLLGAVPHVNRAATLAPVAGGGMLASVPLQPSRRLAWAKRWLLPVSDVRRVQLDALGVSTLELCDGQRSVEQIAERFAADNGLTFREAQLSVAPFIRMLYERGVLAVVGSA